MIKLRFCSLVAAALLSVFAAGDGAAQTVSTGFDLADGFITGPINGSTAVAGAFDAVTVSDSGFEVTFAGGQQQQSFDGGSYQAGGNGYLFANTGGGSAVFTGTSGNTITGGANNGDQTGSISFNIGASEVSFFAADRANGAASTLDIFGVDGSLLQEDISIASGNVSDNFFEFLAADLGGAIGSITFDLPGPNANPPYVLAIDTFSATAASAVPEPSSLALLFGGASCLLIGRRRKR